MSLQKLIRVFALTTAVFALLLFVTEAGEACEAWHHQECNNTCSICHLAQQAVGSALSAGPLVVFERIGPLPVGSQTSFVASSCALQLLTRAPPTA